MKKPGLVSTDPASWGDLPPASGAKPAPKPWVRWGSYDGERWIGVLNISAARFAEAQIIDGDKLGMRIREGAGADKGKFALVFVPHDPRDPLVLSLMPYRRHINLLFSAGSLKQRQARGQSELTPHNGMLIGTFGDIRGYYPRKEREAKAKRNTTPHDEPPNPEQQ